MATAQYQEHRSDPTPPAVASYSRTHLFRMQHRRACPPRCLCHVKGMNLALNQSRNAESYGQAQNTTLIDKRMTNQVVALSPMGTSFTYAT
jgi:hypothetical protein